MAIVGSRLGLSPKQTARMLGADATDPAWWKYPAPETLAAISARSGVRLDHLRAMSFLDWKGLSSPTAEQIVGRRLRTLQVARSPKNQVFVVGPQCLAADRDPWLRRDWLTGWATVCLSHRLVLIERCWQCGLQLRLPGPRAVRSHDPARCQMCDADHRDARPATAHPEVLGLQEQIFTATRDGSAEFTGLGHAEWSMMILVVKLTLWVGWATLNANNEKTRQHLFSTVANDLRIVPPAYSFWQSAYGAILMCAWLLADPASRWSIMPGSAGRSVRKLPALLNDAPPPQRERLQQLFVIEEPAWVLGTRIPAGTPHRDSPIRYAPSIEALRHLADIARNEGMRGRRTGLLRLREGRSVAEVGRETGLPVRTVYRWWCKYRPDRFSQNAQQSRSTPSPQRLSEV